MSLRDLLDRSMGNASGERPLEYEFTWKRIIPLLPLSTHVKKSVKILDVGGGESRLAKTLAELGFNTTVIDIGNIEHGNAKLVKANILDYDFPDNTFDLIISISTVEHIGLTSYKQTAKDPDGDKKTVQKIHRWLKPYGVAILTLPYGKPHHPPTFERVYHQETLKTRILTDSWQIIDIKYTCSKEHWHYCTEKESRDRDAVVMLMLQKK